MGKGSAGDAATGEEKKPLVGEEKSKGAKKPKVDDGKPHAIKEKFAQSTTEAATVAAMRLQHDELGWDEKWGFFVTIILHFFAQAIQIVMVLITFEAKVEALEDPYEESQYVPMRAAMMLGIGTHTPLGAITPAQIQMNTQISTVCETNIGPSILPYCFLFLYFGTFLKQFATSCWRCYIVFLLKTEEPDEKEMLEEEKIHQKDLKKEINLVPPSDDHMVDHMVTPVKAFVIIFIVGPQLVTLLFTGWCGGKFLAYNSDPVKSAKTSLSMGVIIRVTQTVFGYFASESMKTYMEGGSYIIWTAKPSARWAGWLSSVTYMTLSMAMSIFLLSVVFTNVADLHNLCEEWRKAFPEPGATPITSFSFL